MPYIVICGEVKETGVVYKTGDALPYAKGEGDDMVAVGAVEWQEPVKAAEVKRPAVVAKPTPTKASPKR